MNETTGPVKPSTQPPQAASQTPPELLAPSPESAPVVAPALYPFSSIEKSFLNMAIAAFSTTFTARALLKQGRVKEAEDVHLILINESRHAIDEFAKDHNMQGETLFHHWLEKMTNEEAPTS